VLGEPAGYLARPVGAAVEDYDNLVGKGQTGEAFGKLPLLIVHNDQAGEGWPLGPVHAAAFAIERHS
jgi:hypothetical protein